MNGSVAQIVALTCFGNAFLSGKKIESFFPQNTTFSFCDRVDFVFLKQSISGKLEEEELAGTPEEWFDYIKSLNASGIWLSRIPENDPKIPDRMAVAFVGGGGTWEMKVILPLRRNESWITRWQVWNKNAPETRIWRVTYGRVSTGETCHGEYVNLVNSRSRLKKSLVEIHSFSERQNCGGFTKAFSDALMTLDSRDNAFHGYYKDLAPKGFLSNEAISIIDACQQAWVFGGMGSWNDLSFDGDAQRQYERLSEQLFNAINEALAAGANSTYKQLLQSWN